jgi:hypothetical protein
MHTSALGRIESNTEQHNQPFEEIKAKLESIHWDILAGDKDPVILSALGDFNFLEKELVDDHISEADVEQNKDNIKIWLANTTGSGSQANLDSATLYNDPDQLCSPDSSSGATR